MFDNSEGNPANPDPTKAVRWGQQTYEEMHLGYVEYFIDGPGKTTTTDGPKAAVKIPAGGVEIPEQFKGSNATI
ncbi:MAG TPA: hypothetical protein VG122_13295 [Gemmata sp.]|jgi:hypothetical protein|nr:hypothetical protein [Gemmata sp.]